MTVKRQTSSWRSVRLWEQGLRTDLQRSHALWLHGWCIGLLVLGMMWLGAHLQMVLGSESLALRYAITLGLGYIMFLTVLRVWAGMLIKRDGPDFSLDGGGGGGGKGGSGPSKADPPFEPGGGGDFGGGGASGDFTAGEGGSALGDVAGGAVEIAAGADEAAVIVIPVALVFVAGLAVVFGAGSLLLLYFGSEVLLAVAVEVAFGYVAARTAIGVIREGWLSTAVRVTWKPLLGALLCAVLLGGVIDVFMPQARSLPHAVQLMR